MNKEEESKHWESLYYKENARVRLLENKIIALKAEKDYLKSEIAYMKKYKENVEYDK